MASVIFTPRDNAALVVGAAGCRRAGGAGQRRVGAQPQQDPDLRLPFPQVQS